MLQHKKIQAKNDTDFRKIADLCNMCGQCCQGIATDYTHEELIEMAKRNEKEAWVFVDFFAKCESIADARKRFPKKVEQILREKNLNLDLQGDEVTFYYCPRLKDGKCTAYEERPNCCRTAPLNGWVIMPEKCGYRGWQFAERERVKEGIRALKEKAYEVEVLEGQDAYITELDISVKEFKAKLEKNIKPFIQYGAKGW